MVNFLQDIVQDPPPHSNDLGWSTCGAHLRFSECPVDSSACFSNCGLEASFQRLGDIVLLELLSRPSSSTHLTWPAQTAVGHDIASRWISCARQTCRTVCRQIPTMLIRVERGFWQIWATFLCDCATKRHAASQRVHYKWLAMFLA